MFFDMTYIYIVLPAVVLALWASSKVKSTFRRYSKQYSSTHLTGAQAAARILSANGVTDVRVERVQGSLTDNFDPKANVIHLSQDVYDSYSTAAIGVAAHEAGHVLQYADNYAPIRLRAAIIPATNIGSRLAMPLIIIGLILSYMSRTYLQMGLTIAYAGLICFALCALFQLVTLPVEFNASRRALQAIESQGLLNSAELEGSRKVLSAAAMTYVAALAVTLAQLLRFMLLISGSRRN